MNTIATKENQACVFPVIKIDYQFRLIECNAAAMDLLRYWNSSPDEALPLSVLQQYPEILMAIQHNTTPDIDILTDTATIKCTVVPFPEANYIGIYAYLVEFTDQAKEKVTLMRLN
jgi:hypothetical protein